MQLVSLFDQPRSNVAFCLSTKDRPEWTRAMLPTLIAERGFDLFWIDGSTTPEGQSLPGELAATIPQLREIHREVTGGPDVAIIHSLCHMRQLGYEYCGLIENDVRLKPGWFPKLLDLFRLGQEDDLRVGAVTARTYQYRVLVTRPHYAVLYNCGAGMILFRKEAVSSVLRRYRTTTAHEVRRLVLFTVGVDPARTWGGPPVFQNMCADWFFDVSLLLDGYCTLGLLPAMADDLDPKAAKACRGYASCPSEIPPSEELRFSQFAKNHQALVAAQQRPPFAHAAAILRREDEQCWHVYPHQAVSLGVARLEGDWRIQWEQLLGPFVYETTTDGARVTMELFGPGKFLLSIGGGEIDVIVDGSGVRYKAEAGSEMQILRCPVGSTSDSASYILRHVELVWHKPADASGANARLRWSGLLCQEIQPWFREEIPIDADFLRAYLPSPGSPATNGAKQRTP